ncbi:MAG: nucleoside triphosphate pyrophosphohydrolase [Candidatus Latescibacterota bacterium]|nr:MAG: nucleoside triphosphate pyrophosphohydrolase [Candidatus Latescibacterota bacterium]
MENKALDRLFDLIRTLRGENGCPWDREQTIGSILSDLIEETYELQWAQARRSGDELLEELGDVLFVYVFAVVLLQEKDPTATIDRIASLAYDKIRRRHPHVFGDAVAKTKIESLAHWDRIKAEEKNETTPHREPFSTIPDNLPPIRKAEKIQRLAAETGFDWSDTKGILEKIREEINEVEEILKTGSEGDIREEMGDLLFSVINLTRFLNIDGEAALTRANAKFIERYAEMERLAHEDGHRLDDLTLEEMDRYWNRTKKRD